MTAIAAPITESAMSAREIAIVGPTQEGTSATCIRASVFIGQ